MEEGIDGRHAPGSALQAPPYGFGYHQNPMKSILMDLGVEYFLLLSWFFASSCWTIKYIIIIIRSDCMPCWVLADSAVPGTRICQMNTNQQQSCHNYIASGAQFKVKHSEAVRKWCSGAV